MTVASTRSSDSLQVGDARRRSRRANGSPCFPCQFLGTAQQSVEEQSAADVTMQVVFVGEPDTAEHLLAMPRGRHRGLTCCGLGQQ